MDFDFLVLSDIHECQTGKHNCDADHSYGNIKTPMDPGCFCYFGHCTHAYDCTTHYPFPPPLLIVIYNANVLYNVKKELK